MIIKLQSTSAIAEIDTKGAELISLQDVFGVEYMWQKDPKFWPRSSPVLFPIVGALKNNKTIIDGTEYTIPKHGFCRDAEFTVVYKTENTVLLRYMFNEETLTMYPYKFALTLGYTLNVAELELNYTVLNLDDKPIDFCLGAHPAFNIPINNQGNFEEYCVELNKPEPDGTATYDLVNSCINTDNRINPIKDGRIPLNKELFSTDTVIFDKLQSNSVKVFSIKSGRGVQVDMENFDFLALWTPDPANSNFLCIEPWCGLPNCADEDEKFTSKRGVKHLEIDQQFSCKMTIIPV